MFCAIVVVDPSGLPRSRTGLEKVMKKFSTLAAAAALAFAAAAPVAAEEANVNADPFVSSQGSLALAGPGAAIAAVVIGAIIIAAVDSSDDT